MDIECTSSRKYIKTTSMCGTFSQNTYWRLAEDIIQWKRQEKSPHNWIGEKKRGEKGIGMRAIPLVGSCEIGKLPSPWGPPSPVRRSAGMDNFKNSQAECKIWSSALQHKQTSIDDPCVTALPRLRCTVTGCWLSGFSGQAQWKDSVWLCRDSLKVLECGLGSSWGCVQHGV